MVFEKKMVFAEVKSLPKYVSNYFAKKEYALINLDLGIYYFWAGLRILLALLPQNGYIPFSMNEYIQSDEVLPGNTFDTDSNVPFEFNSTNPMRSIPAFYLTIYIPMYILRTISDVIESIEGLNLAARHLMWVLPRLSMVMLSFISDICLFKICYSFRQDFKKRLVIFASSFISLIFMTRTFTNSIEMVCFNILLCLVSLCIADTENSSDPYSCMAFKLKERTTIPYCVGINHLVKMIHKHALKRSIPIALVTVTGFFNRPTFFLFAFTPLFYWFLLGIRNGISKSDYHKEIYKRIFVFFLHCIPVISFFICFDSVYYGFITWRNVLNLNIGFKNFVVTPYNYLTCDLDFVDVSKYGVNSKPHHLLVNTLLTINVFFLVVTNVIFRFVYEGRYPNWSLMPISQSITRMMTLSYIIPVMSLTSIPRQEPWFIFPIFLPLVMLYSHIICGIEDEIETVERIQKRHQRLLIIFGQRDKEKYFLNKDYIDVKGKHLVHIRTWYLFNVVFVLFYQFIAFYSVYEDAIYE